MKRLVKTLVLVSLFVFVCFGGVGQAAQTASVTEYDSVGVFKVRWDWTSNAAGTVNETTVGKSLKSFHGKIVAMVTIPDTNAPTDNYDISILDNDGHDVLLDGGLNRDTSNTEYVKKADLGAVNGTRLRVKVLNAGDSNQGVIILWIKQ